MKTGGFSLLELVFALVLLQVGILGTVGMIHLSQRNLQRAELTLKGTVEGLWIVGSGTELSGPGIQVERWGEISWVPEPTPVPSLRIHVWSPALRDTLVSFRVLPRIGIQASLEPGAVALLGSW